MLFLEGRRLRGAQRGAVPPAKEETDFARNDEGLPCSNPAPVVQAVGTCEASSLFPAVSLLCRRSQADWQVETMEVVVAGLG